MKFTNVFSIGLVLGSALFATTALPITTNAIVAREPDVLVLARSFHELSTRDPWFGKAFRIFKPFIKPLVSMIPKVGGTISKFIPREESDDELLEDLFQLASENTVAARSFHELDARDPFLGRLFRIVRPFIKPVASAIGKFIKREVSEDELLEELLQLASENKVAARSPQDLDAAITNAVLAALAGDADVAARDLYELDAREPISIPPELIKFGVQHGPALVKAAIPAAKKVVKWFKSLWRRDGDMTADDVVGLLADIVADMKPSVSRRDADDAAWDDFVQALQDAAAR